MIHKSASKPTFSRLEAIIYASMGLALLGMIWHFLTYYGHLIEGGIKY